MSASGLKMEIGKRVHDFRTEHHYTQAQFAEMMDVSVNFLSEIENGKKGMSQETICRLCSYCDISADYLLFGTASKNASVQNLVEIATSLNIQDLELVIDYLMSLKKIKELDI